jgi:hypothetical protein
VSVGGAFVVHAGARTAARIRADGLRAADIACVPAATSCSVIRASRRRATSPSNAARWHARYWATRAPAQPAPASR